MTEPSQDENRPDRIARIMHGIASVALVAMMLVVVVDVFLRFVFNLPVRGAYDLVSICLLVMVFFGIGPVIARRGEILIDLLDEILPRKVLRALAIIAAIGTLAVFAFLVWTMIDPALDAYRYGDRSLELGLPVWILWALAFAGLAGILWISLIALSRTLRGGIDGHDATPGEEGAL